MINHVKRLSVVALVLGATLGVGSRSGAADYTWNNSGSGGSGNWLTSSNWSPSGFPNAVADTAIFSGEGNSLTTIALGGIINLVSLSFDSASTPTYTLGVGTTDQFTFAAAGTINIGSTVTAAQVINAKVVKSGALTINNNGSGGLTLNGAFTQGATNFRVDGTGITTLTGVITGTSAGTLTKVGSGTLSINANNATFAGSITVASGTLRSAPNGSPSNAPLPQSNFRWLGTGTITLGSAETGASNVALYLDKAGFMLSNSLIVPSQGTGTVTIGSGEGLPADPIRVARFNGPLTINRSVILYAGSDVQTIFGGTMSGSSSVTIRAPAPGNRIIFGQTGSNFFGGNVFVESGTLQLGIAVGTSNRYIPDGADVAVSPGATFQLIATTAAPAAEAIDALTGEGRVTTLGGMVGDASQITLTVGAGNGTGTFSGELANATGNLNLVKAGTGTQTLSGITSYTGTTAVTAGTLVLTGTATLATSSIVTTRDGGLLDVTGLTGGFARMPGQTLTAGRTGTPGVDVLGDLTINGGTLTTGVGAKTATLAGNLALNNAYITVDLFNASVVGGVNDLIAVQGSFNLTGTNTIILSEATMPGTGNYTALTYSGPLTGLTNLTAAIPASVRPTWSAAVDLASQPGAVLVTIDGDGANLTWTGAASAEWTVNASANWSAAGSPTTYFNWDAVRFDDGGSAASLVSLVGPLVPTSTTVDTTVNYTFQGTGSIAGHGSLTKAGAGTLAIGTTNTFSGPVTITGGVVQVATFGNSGVNGPLGAGDQITMDGGTIRLTSSASSQTTNRAVALGSGGGAIDILGNFYIDGPFSGSGTLTKLGSGTLTLAGTALPAAIVLAGTPPFDLVDQVVISTYETTLAGTSSITIEGRAIPNSLGIVATQTVGPGTTLRMKTGLEGATSLDTQLNAFHFDYLPMTWNGPILLSGAGRAYLKTIAQFFVSGAISTGEGGFTGALTTTGARTQGYGPITIQGGLNIPDGRLVVDYNIVTIMPNPANAWRSTAIVGGEVILGGNNSLPATGTVTLGGPDIQKAALDLNGWNQTVSGLAVANNGIVSIKYYIGNRSDTNDSTLTFAGAAQPPSTFTAVIRDNALQNNSSSTPYGSRKLSLLVASGSLTLSGANIYTGGTTITGGTLRIGDGGTTGSIAGNILNNAELTFDRSDASAFAGTISGTGSLTKTGAGKLSLTGLNTYTGATNIAQGTLAISNNLTGPGGDITIAEGAILEAAGAIQRSLVFPGATQSGTVVATGNLALLNFLTPIDFAGRLDVGAFNVQFASPGMNLLRTATLANGGALGSGTELRIYNNTNPSNPVVGGTGVVTINANATVTFNGKIYAGTQLGETATIQSNDTFSSATLNVTGILRGSPQFNSVDVNYTGGGQLVTGFSTGATSQFGGTNTLTSPIRINVEIPAGQSPSGFTYGTSPAVALTQGNYSQFYALGKRNANNPAQKQDGKFIIPANAVFSLDNTVNNFYTQARPGDTFTFFKTQTSPSYSTYVDQNGITIEYINGNIVYAGSLPTVSSFQWVGNAPTLDAGTQWSVIATADTIALTVVPVPEPGMILGIAAALGMVGWVRRNKLAR